MHLKKIKKYTSNGKVFLTAEVEAKHFNKAKQIFFSYPEKYVNYIPENADPFFPAVMMPAMRYGEDLVIDSPVSQKLMNSQSLIQDIFITWYPEDLKRIRITASEINESEPEPRNRNATFFSLGVDSMYTMLKYLTTNDPPPGKELSVLIYMKGLELPLSIYKDHQEVHVIQSIKELTAHYNLDVIVGETNIRDIFPLRWDTNYSGPGLSSVALSLCKGFDHIYIPSSHSYANLSANPSSPLTDRLWSNGQVKIIHDGAEAERAEKIETLIVKNTIALNKLRVCVDNAGGDYNCGKCWKCLQTMVTLKIVGKLKNSKSFPDELPENSSNSMQIYNHSSLKFTMENLKLAQKYNDKQMEKVLSREIRFGKLDLLRDKRPIYFLFNEMLYYYWWKILKKSGVS